MPPGARTELNRTGSKPFVGRPLPVPEQLQTKPCWGQGCSSLWLLTPEVVHFGLLTNQRLIQHRMPQHRGTPQAARAVMAGAGGHSLPRQVVDTKSWLACTSALSDCPTKKKCVFRLSLENIESLDFIHTKFVPKNTQHYKTSDFYVLSAII